MIQAYKIEKSKMNKKAKETGRLAISIHVSRNRPGIHLEQLVKIFVAIRPAFVHRIGLMPGMRIVISGKK